MLCDFCARFCAWTYQNETRKHSGFSMSHHPDIYSLLSSARSCRMCHALRDILGEANVQYCMAAAGGGSYTRTNLIGNSFLPIAAGYFEEFEISTWGIEVWCSGRYISECFLLTTSKEPLSSRAIWSYPSKVPFQQRARTIRNWVDTCKARHFACSAPGHDAEFELPRRFIEILSHDGATTTRLVDTKDWSGKDDVPYIALSHCWGKNGVPLKTTRKNLDAFMSKIAIGSLAQTFQDAITITRNLGVRHLWIDALCIVQDDNMDWQIEAAKMSGIFRNAYLTLSATADSGHGGCGVSPLERESFQFDVPQSPHTLQTSIGIGSRVDRPLPQDRQCIYIRSREHELPSYRRMGLWPIHKRGWIFQELFLSRRIVYFDTSGTFFWQCGQMLESELGNLRRNIEKPLADNEERRITDGPLVGFDNLRDSPRKSSVWVNWLADYFSREFTYPRDSIPALAGTIKVWEKLTGDVPILGMWHNDIHSQLLWQLRYNGREIQEPFDPTELDGSQPSWSWTSIWHSSRAKINWREPLSHTGEKRIWKTEVIKFDIEWESTPYTSPLRRGSIVLNKYQITGFTKELGSNIHLDTKQYYETYFSNSAWENRVRRAQAKIPPWYLLENPRIDKHELWSYDSKIDGPLKIVHLPLFASFSSMGPPYTVVIFSLLVEKVQDAKFRRVGTATFCFDYGAYSEETARLAFMNGLGLVGAMELI